MTHNLWRCMHGNDRSCPKCREMGWDIGRGAVDAEVYDGGLPAEVHLEVWLSPDPRRGYIDMDAWSLHIAETGQKIADIYRANVEYRHDQNDVVVTLSMNDLVTRVDGVVDTTLATSVKAIPERGE